MKKISLKAWVKQHRADIDAVIRKNSPDIKINDNERVEWVLNDEALYNWAGTEAWVL